MVTRKQVLRAIGDIKHIHACGRKALGSDGTRRKLTEAGAEKIGIPLMSWYTARQFAEGFDREALDELCKLVKTQVGREGYVFGRTAMIISLSVPGAKRRHKFIEKAIRRGWSAREIRREIARQFGRRRNGGRRPDAPERPGRACANRSRRSCPGLNSDRTFFGINAVWISAI